MRTITVAKSDKRLAGSLPIPSSKSLSNRILILRQLFPGQIEVNNLSRSDDTQLLEALLQEINTKREAEHRMLDAGNAGTVMRFLTAYLSTLPGKWILKGSERMKQRPIGALVDALRNLGANIEYLGRIGYPPLMIKGRTLKGGEISIDSTTSSQFISALLLIAPSLENGLKIKLEGEVVSSPYIDMTLGVMNSVGLHAFRQNEWIVAANGQPGSQVLTVESDWSAAAFWFEAAAFADDVDLFLQGLQKESLQGDSILSSIFENFGVESEFTTDGVRLSKEKSKADGYYFDFKDHPDLAPAVITTCLAIGMRGRFEGLKGLVIKETDRLRALKSEYKRIGARLNPDSNSELVQGIEFSSQHLNPSQTVTIYTYEDHRMAMAFAPLALMLGAIRIENPNVVTKSYPGFWAHLTALGFDIS
jgi:3-phosphoshikimate 1-carboxyvinyltransferase